MTRNVLFLSLSLIAAGALAVTSVTIAPETALAQGKGKGNGVGKGKGWKNEGGKPGKSWNKGPKKWRAVGPFETREIDVIRGFFSQYSYRSYYGTAPRRLPPGMRNRLAQGKRLPPGIAKRSLPPRLLESLPYRPGYRYYAVGTDVILVNIATNIIVDIAIGLLR